MSSGNIAKSEPYEFNILLTDKVENFFGTTNRKEKDPYVVDAELKEEEIFNEEEQA